MPPPQKFFLIFCLAMMHFGAFWALVLMLVYKACKTESKSSFVCQLPIELAVNVTSLLFTCMDAGSKRISFITEGLPWKITVNSWSIGAYRKKQLYKKEREQRSRAFPLTRTLILMHCDVQLVI